MSTSEAILKASSTGTPLDAGVGAEEVGVEPVPHVGDAVRPYAEVLLDEARALLRRRQHAFQAPRDERLHADRIEGHRSQGVSEARVPDERRAAIDRERVVDRRDDRHAEAPDSEDPVAQALYVVDEVVARARA